MSIETWMTVVACAAAAVATVTALLAIRTERVGDVTVAKLTERGLDHAEGRATVPELPRIEPGCPY